MIYYYSGCGDSRWVAQELAKRLGQELLFIPEELKGNCLYTLKGDEPLGFVFPTYAWRPPQIVRQFVQKMRVDSCNRSPYTFMVTTCGDSIGHADKIFARLLLRSLSLTLHAAYGITMPETYINLPGFHLDSKEDEKNKLALARTNLPTIASLLQREVREVNVVRGKMPWLTSSVVAWLFEKLLMTDRRFEVGNLCIGCGTCSKVCPVGNITLEHVAGRPQQQENEDTPSRPQWHGNCLSCMACYHYCPVNAIHWGNATKGKGQYHFPE